MEAAARGGGSGSRPLSFSRRNSRGFRAAGALSAGRSQHGLRAGHVDFEGVGTGHDRGGLEVAGYVGTHFRQAPGLAEESLGHDQQTRKFCERFVERAFRRPLTEHAAGALHRPPLPQRARPGIGRSSRGDAGAGLASIPLSFQRRRRLRYGRRGCALVLGIRCPTSALLEAAAAGRLATPEQIRVASPADAGRPPGPGQSCGSSSCNG